LTLNPNPSPKANTKPSTRTFSLTIALTQILRDAHKIRPHKFAKIVPSPRVRKMPALAQLPCPCGHALNFGKFEIFSTNKCRRLHLKNCPLLPCPQNVRTGQILSPLTTNVFYGQPLTMLQPKHNLILVGFQASDWEVDLVLPTPDYPIHEITAIKNNNVTIRPFCSRKNWKNLFGYRTQRQRC